MHKLKQNNNNNTGYAKFALDVSNVLGCAYGFINWELFKSRKRTRLMERLWNPLDF